MRFADLNDDEKERVLAEGFRWVREENDGRLPLAAYTERCKTFPTVFIDVAVVWKGQLLLVKRSQDDALYPGTWHVSGGAVVGRESPDDVIRRQLEEGGIAPSSAHVYFGGVIAMPKTEAEIAWCVFHLAILDKKPEETKTIRLFPIYDLPKGFVQHQRVGYIPLIRRLLAGGSPELVAYLGKG